jgi:hypothetical protein
MPLHSYFEFSCKQFGWRDIAQLFRSSFVEKSGLLDIYEHGGAIHISIEALGSESARQDWICDAQKLALSDAFIAIATNAAERGASKICVGLHDELDPELETFVQPCTQGRTGASANATPYRYVIAENWGHVFLNRYGKDTVRWVADWEYLMVTEVQVYDLTSRQWEEAAPSEFCNVVNRIRQNGFLADPERWGLIQSDELPKWAAD